MDFPGLFIVFCVLLVRIFTVLLIARMLQAKELTVKSIIAVLGEMNPCRVPGAG